MDLDQMLEAALKNVLPQGEMVSKAQVEEMLSGLKTELTSAIEGMVAKALPVDRTPAADPKGALTKEDEFEADPVSFLVKKGEAESIQEKAVAVALFKREFDNLKG